MMETALDTVSWILIGLGSVSVLTGGIGVLRLPDIYTRMHAAGITDTAGAALFMVAMMLQAPDWLVAVKLLLILVFLYFTSPTSSFALAHAAITSNIKPILAPEEDDDQAEPGAEQGRTQP